MKLTLIILPDNYDGEFVLSDGNDINIAMVDDDNAYVAYLESKFIKLDASIIVRTLINLISNCDGLIGREYVFDYEYSGSSNICLSNISSYIDALDEYTTISTGNDFDVDDDADDYINSLIRGNNFNEFDEDDDDDDYYDDDDDSDDDDDYFKSLMDDDYDLDDDDEDADISSHVFGKSDRRKKHIKKYGIIISSRKHRKKDRVILMDFLTHFIPGDKDYIVKYRNEVCDRWMNSYCVSYKRHKRIIKECSKKHNRDMKLKDDSINRGLSLIESAVKMSIDPWNDPRR